MEKLYVQNSSDSGLDPARCLKSPFLAYIAALVGERLNILLFLVELESGENHKTDTGCRFHLFDVLSVPLVVWDKPVCNTNLTDSASKVQLE
jgi:hypothetical protein